MINKQLELTINSQQILNRLAMNLGVDVISENTSIKKMADAYEVEQRNYSDAVEKSIRNGFLTTMDDDLFEQYAANYGIYRKRYNKIRLLPLEKVIELSVNTDISVTSLSNFSPFSKGDVLYSDEIVSITSLSDIIFSNLTSIVYPFVEITLKDDSSSYSYNTDDVLSITPKDKSLSVSTPYYKMKFNNYVGLANAIESIDDFKVRVYESLYMANNNANSLISMVTKEVPLLLSLETSSIEEGRAIDIVYPYTQTLVQYGYDPLVNSLIIPMIESSISTKAYYNNMLLVKEPKPIPVIAAINYSTDKTANAIEIEQIKIDFNNNNYKLKSFTVSGIKEEIAAMLGKYSVRAKDIKLSYISTIYSEDFLELSDFETISIDIGKFLTLVDIQTV